MKVPHSSCSVWLCRAWLNELVAAETVRQRDLRVDERGKGIQ